jgi:hypothetical protein
MNHPRKSSGVNTSTGENMKKYFRPLLFISLLVLFALACADSTAPVTTISTAAPTTEVAAAPTDAPAAAKLGKVGDTVTQGDYKITLANAEKNTAYGTFAKAEAGKMFVAIEIIVESGADTGVSVNPFYCKLTDGDAYAYNVNAFGKDPSLSSQNDLPKGEKMRGWVTFEVPDTAKDFVFSYSPISFTDKTRIRFSLGF